MRRCRSSRTSALVLTIFMRNMFNNNECFIINSQQLIVFSLWKGALLLFLGVFIWQDLTDRKYKSESSIRELKSKLSTLEEEHMRVKQELQGLRKQNSSLDGEYHEKEKLIHQLTTRVAVLEQEVKDKEMVINKSTDLLSSEQERKVGLKQCLLKTIVFLPGEKCSQSISESEFPKKKKRKSFILLRNNYLLLHLLKIFGNLIMQRILKFSLC